MRSYVAEREGFPDHIETQNEWMERMSRNARRYRWVRDDDTGIVLAVKRIGGASFKSGTYTDLMSATRSLATALNTFTAEASIIAGLAEGTTDFAIPAGSIPPLQGIGKVFKVVCRGTWGATGTPSFTWTCRLVSAAGALMGTTSALAVTAITNVEWEWELDLVVLTTGPSTTATCRGTGMLHTRTTASAAAAFFMGAGSAAGTPTPATPTTAGFDSTIANAVIPCAISTVSNAANQILLTQGLLYGLN